jgi:hypothetical protein
MTPTRIGDARTRAHTAKTALGIVSAAAFAAAMLLTRVSHAGQAKHPLQSLSAPPSFVAAVREDQLRAGILAPASAPPDAASSVS